MCNSDLFACGAYGLTSGQLFWMCRRFWSLEELLAILPWCEHSQPFSKPCASQFQQQKAELRIAGSRCLAVPLLIRAGSLTFQKHHHDYTFPCQEHGLIEYANNYLLCLDICSCSHLMKKMGNAANSGDGFCRRLESLFCIQVGIHGGIKELYSRISFRSISQQTGGVKNVKAYERKKVQTNY